MYFSLLDNQLYHGSFCVVRNPDVTLGNKNKDFGQGFYTTTSIEQASEWARISSFIKNRQENNDRYTPRLNTYKAIGNQNDLTVYQFPDRPTVEWLDFVVMNRYPDAYYPFKSQLLADIDKYDIIIGPIADNMEMLFI